MSSETPSNVVPMESLAAFYGGEEVSVMYRDGRTEAVLVRELNFLEVAQYAQSFGVPENQLAQLFTGRDAEFVGSLSRQSVVDIVVKGEEMNLPFTVAWMRRQSDRQAKVVGILGLDQQDAIVKAVVSHLAASSPTSGPSSADQSPTS